MNKETLTMLVQVILMFLSWFFERNKEKKAEKAELRKEADDARRRHDPSAVTAVFDRLNRM